MGREHSPSVGCRESPGKAVTVAASNRRREKMSDNAHIDHSKKHPAYHAYVVRDGKNGEKGFWTKLGAAWKSKDGKGFVLQLDCVPLDGRVVLREPKDD
jgi:hypothetical protein